MKKIIFLLFIITACSKEAPDTTYSVENNRPELSADRKTIIFPQKSVGLKQFVRVPVGKKGEFISVIAPSRVIAAIFPRKGQDPKVVFENSELNEIYYNFAQATQNRKNYERNYERLQEMAKQQAATVKELRDGERDLLNSRYSEIEFQNKVRAQGFDPKFLTSKTDTVILVSDIPEIQINHVEMEENVDVYFNSYPQDKFSGKVIHIGEVIDPVSRTLKIVTSLPNLNGKFRPGMYAKIEFGDFNSQAMSLPLTSLFTVDGKNFVFVAVNDHSFALREVTPSFYGDQTVGIYSGLKEGEMVVSEGVLLLKRIIFGH